MILVNIVMPFLLAYKTSSDQRSTALVSIETFKETRQTSPSLSPPKTERSMACKPRVVARMLTAWRLPCVCLANSTNSSPTKFISLPACLIILIHQDVHQDIAWQPTATGGRLVFLTHLLTHSTDTYHRLLCARPLPSSRLQCKSIID